VEEEAVYLTADRKKRVRKERGSKYNLQRHSTSDLLPPSGLKS
jgi:hypothetical protein